MTLPMSRPARFSGLLVMNTTPGTGDVPLSKGFLAWRAFVRGRPDFDIAALMRRSTPGLSREEAAAYSNRSDFSSTVNPSPSSSRRANPEILGSS